MASCSSSVALAGTEIGSPKLILAGLNGSGSM